MISKDASFLPKSPSLERQYTNTIEEATKMPAVKGEAKLDTLIGFMIAIIPIVSIESASTLPKMFPIPIWVSFLSDARIAKAISGKHVPIATTMPIRKEAT